MNTRIAWQLSSPLFLCILSSGCYSDHPVKTAQEQPGDECVGYSGLTVSLGEATIRCTGTIGPKSFVVDQKGLLSATFTTCTDDPKNQSLERVTKLLQLQNFRAALPHYQECLTERFNRWSELFGRISLNSCPTWSEPTVIAADYRASLVQLSKMQPKLQYIPASEKNPRFNPTGNEKFVDITVPAKTSIVYKISYPQGEPTCGDPAVCAAQCAAFLPGFVVSAGNGQVVADPASWFRDESGFLACSDASSTDPWCPPYVHAMSVTRTSYSSHVPPGDIYGHPNRGGVGEHCFRYAPDPGGGPGSNYETDLLLQCTSGTTECLSKCGN